MNVPLRCFALCDYFWQLRAFPPSLVKWKNYITRISKYFIVKNKPVNLFALVLTKCRSFLQYLVNEHSDLNRLLFLSQPSLVSHDSDTVPAVYSKSNTISLHLHLHCFSLTSKNEHACLFLGPNLKMLSIAFVRLLKMLRWAKKA